MRRPLDALYRLTAWLAALALVAIAGLILAQVVLRVFGTQVKSADDFAGYALVATICLGLAPTYRHNSHIRVALLIERFAPESASRRAFERLVTGASALLVGWAAWVLARFVYDSWQYHEVSQGLLAIPLWMPQLPMAFGVFVLFVALLDDLVTDFRTGTQSHLAVAASGDDMPVER